MKAGQVRRRPDRQAATVVVTGDRVVVEGIDPDELGVLALAHGLDHRRDGTGWTFAAEDALRVAAALRSSGRQVRLSSGIAS